MKIWIVNHYADPPEGGKYLRHFHFAKELISRGHEVMIIKAGFAVSTAAARAGWPRAGFRKGADCRRGGECECLPHNPPHAHA